ncbi:MAG TPA: nuclear transport factor 2 family protein [Thermoleophilaceae bacterium]
MIITHTAARELTRAEMDTLIDGHFRAEEAGDIDAIVEGFIPGAQHDVAGRPGGPLYGGEEIAAYYRGLLADLRITRFETVRRRYGTFHAVDESILYASAEGSVFGMEGGGREVSVRLLHVFDFSGGLISRESAWLDVASLQRQLAERTQHD